MAPANRAALISDLYAFLRGKKKHFLHVALDKRIGCELATEQQQYCYDKIETCSLLFYILEEALYCRG